MLASLFVILLASAQPAPAEEPVVTEAEAQAEVQADGGVEVAVPVAAEVAADATAEADAAAAAAEPQEEVVCRRRVIPAERVGQRHRVVRDCRPASEWPSRRRNGA